MIKSIYKTEMEHKNGKIFLTELRSQTHSYLRTVIQMFYLLKGNFNSNNII